MLAGNSQPTLETPRLIMRPPRIGDFDDIAALWADRAVVHYIYGEPQGAEASWSRLLRHIGHWQALGFGFWIIEAKADGRFIGEAGFVDYRRAIVPAVGDLPEAGWVLKATAHGQGFATEAVEHMTNWADDVLPAAATFGIFNPANAASVMVATKVGYVDAGMAAYNNKSVWIMKRERGATTREPLSHSAR